MKQFSKVCLILFIFQLLIVHDSSIAFWGKKKKTKGVSTCAHEIVPLDDGTFGEDSKVKINFEPVFGEATENVVNTEELKIIEETVGSKKK